MSVSASISDALRRFGRPMVLRRTKLGPNNTLYPLDVTVYGTTKNFAPEEIVGDIIQGDSIVTISNSEIAAAQWPGPPIDNDIMIIDGRQRKIRSVETKYLAAEKLVHVCQVTG